jgi:hypothetical protein
MEGYRVRTYKARNPSQMLFYIKHNGILKNYQSVKPFKMWIPTRGDWNIPVTLVVWIPVHERIPGDE